ncbi:pentapeptide repeat-containing protein [Streptomyces xantholiticus]|uniref:pentapeptide repeat-containing protein n=1 Tax=Streptomyces xantholiticus TaxID=68285 RepID=UPI001E336936|nr:pentapeptide repeat-containing protein [Streptomyces xantholiticus]
MKSKTKRRLSWGGSTAATVFFIVALMWGPWLIEGDHVRDNTLAPSAGIIITGLRTAIVAVLAGLIALGSLHLSYRNHKISLDQLRETQKQFDLAQRQFAQTQEQFAHTQAKDQRQEELTREGQVTDRYVEAIKLLSADGRMQCLGGLYSLERIMRDSEKDHATVVEVLAAFIRAHAPLEKGGKGEKDDAHPTGAAEDGYRFVPKEEVRAALTVLGRRPPRDESFRVDLSDTALHGAQLPSARLDRANLFGVDLSEADLSAARLTGADLTAADLSSADLTGADLTGAVLHETDLTDVVLKSTDLDGTTFQNVGGCTVESLLPALLSSSTKLPPELANDQRIQARIRECESEQGSGRAATMGLAGRLEERPSGLARTAARSSDIYT